MCVYPTPPIPLTTIQQHVLFAFYLTLTGLRSLPLLFFNGGNFEDRYGCHHRLACLFLFVLFVCVPKHATLRFQ